MNASEKILFIYPTIPREGGFAQKPYNPDSVVYGISSTEKQTVIVTAGVRLLFSKNSHLTIDILKHGEMISPDNHETTGFQEIISDHVIDKDEMTIITSMHVKDVVFKNSGTYEIKCTLFENDSDGNKKVADMFSCYIVIVVAEER